MSTLTLQLSKTNLTAEQLHHNNWEVPERAPHWSWQCPTSQGIYLYIYVSGMRGAFVRLMFPRTRLFDYVVYESMIQSITQRTCTIVGNTGHCCTMESDSACCHQERDWESEQLWYKNLKVKACLLFRQRRCRWLSATLRIGDDTSCFDLIASLTAALKN